MKPLLSVAAVCLLSTLLAAQKTTSFHSTEESAFALGNANGTQVQVDVFRGDTSAFLFTFTLTLNADGSFAATDGFGTIPTADFTNGGLEQMSLNVDTSQVPGFQSTSCTFSFTPFFSESCTQGPLGVIQVHWTNTRIISESLLFEDHQTVGGSLTVDSHVDSTQTSAQASGSYLGLSFVTMGQAFMDLNRDTTITITQ